MTSKAFAPGSRSIAAFIDWDPTTVALLRYERVPTPDGGHRRGDLLPVGELTVRITANRNIATGSPQRVTEAGHLVTPGHYVIAMPGADIAIGDRFVLGTDTIEVVYVDVHGPDYRVVAEGYAHAG